MKMMSKTRKRSRMQTRTLVAKMMRIRGHKDGTD